MREVVGDIWSAHRDGSYIVIPTNGATRRRDGACVMGRGLALESALRYPRFPLEVGRMLTRHGNHTRLFSEYRMIAFPVKHHWREPASLPLIERSAEELNSMAQLWFRERRTEVVWVPRVGCGNGGLSWGQVRPVLARTLLDHRFLIVSLAHEALAPA